MAVARLYIDSRRPAKAGFFMSEPAACGFFYEGPDMSLTIDMDVGDIFLNMGGGESVLLIVVFLGALIKLIRLINMK